MSGLVGSEHPRIWTPPLRKLTPDTSLGFECVEFGEQVLGMTFYPWQRWLLVHALELHPDSVASDEVPLFRFDTIVTIVGRQSGKTELIKVKKLWRIYVDGAKTAIATAQDLANSEKAWAEAVILAQSEPDLDAEIAKIDLTASKKSLHLTSGSQYRVAASSRRGGRGFSADDLDLDELREHQNWESWGAVTPTTLARPRSQIWCWSNAGDVTSLVLWFLRAQALAGAEGVDDQEREAFTRGLAIVDESEVEDIGDSLALFEWSAHPKAGLWDRQAWAQSCPALGHGLVTERKIGGLVRGSPEWTARNEILCQWRMVAAGGVFPDGKWEQGYDEQSSIPLTNELFICIDVSWDRSVSHIAVAGRRDDGKIHAEVVASRAGTDWVIRWLQERGTLDPKSGLMRHPEPKHIGGVTVQTAGCPASSFVEKLQAATWANGDPLPYVPWGGPDLGRAHGDIFDLVDTGVLKHRADPLLDKAARTAVKQDLADGVWVFSRTKSPSNCAPMIAVVGAVWLLQDRPDKSKKPMIHEWPEDLVREMESWR